jgi:hypothetical protein
MAANVFRDMCYNYRDQMVAGIIVAGWDKRDGGQVRNDACSLHVLIHAATSQPDIFMIYIVVVTVSSGRDKFQTTIF